MAIEFLDTSNGYTEKVPAWTTETPVHAYEMNIRAGMIMSSIVALREQIKDGVNADEALRRDCENALTKINAYGANTIYPADLDNKGKDNNTLWVNIPEITSYDELDGKLISVYTGIYANNSVQKVYLNVNGLGSKMIKKVVTESGYYIDTYQPYEINRYTVMQLYIAGSSVYWVNPTSVSLDTINDLQERLSEKEALIDEELPKKLNKKVVQELPTQPLVYDFEDAISRFTALTKCSTATESGDDGYYQTVISTSGSIGSSENCTARLDFSSVTADAKSVAVEFDVNMVNNGRWHISLCDLDVRDTLSTVRYATEGIAADIASNSSNRFQINGTGNAHETFFNTWVHCEFVIDFTAKTVKYTLTNKNDTSDVLNGTAELRNSDCTRITGIELYTWLQNDTVYFDNISITARTDVDEYAVYMVPQNDGTYRSYIYIDGEPYEIGNSEQLETEIKDLNTRTDVKIINAGDTASAPNTLYLVTEGETSATDEIDAVSYDNVIFSPDEPEAGENWYQTNGADDTAAVQADSGEGGAENEIERIDNPKYTIQNGRLTVLKEPEKDTTFLKN